MNVEETITIVTRMPPVQILLAPINASAQQDILVMAWLAQVIVAGNCGCSDTIHVPSIWIVNIIHAHVLVHHVVLRMTAGPKPTLQLGWGFCVSLIVVAYFWVISFCRVFRLSGLRAFKSFCSSLKIRILFVPCNGRSTVCPCEFNCGPNYCQVVYILCAGRHRPKLFNLRVLYRTCNVSLLAILPLGPVRPVKHVAF